MNFVLVGGALLILSVICGTAFAVYRLYRRRLMIRHQAGGKEK